MELSSKLEYALIALLELAAHAEQTEPLQLKQIAANQGIPDRYLEQVFAALRHAGIVRSQRGNKGGYLLSREPWQITVLEVFECLEDSQQEKRSQSCNSPERSIISDIWKEMRQDAKEVLRRHTLRDLHQQREIRQRLSGMYYI